MSGISGEERMNLILSIGTHHGERPYSPTEVAEVINKALSSGSSLQKIANLVHLENTTMLTRFLKLLELPQESKHLVDWGKGDSTSLSFSAASLIARLESKEDKILLVKATLENQLLKEEVKQIVQIRERSGKSVPTCIEEILQLRPIIEKRQLLIGAVTSERLRCFLEKISQKERNKILRTTIDSHNPDLPPWDGRLGTRRFTLMGDEAFGDEIKALPRGFEEAINSFLLEAIRE